ncbi:MAG TPA: Rrf2 family transcriptional regulator [Saprospiraceae bacterium]|nr:Rrf2 family transcriptional regulator [Saprospiraceae bacterium]
MKISAKEEHGLRILLRIARNKDKEGLSINQLSEEEGLSVSYVAKITRILRMQGFIQSTPGRKGGYVLHKKPADIPMMELLSALDGRLFDDAFCANHSGSQRMCTNSVDCSTRSLWRIIQMAVDKVLENVTLQHLMGDEYNSDNILQEILDRQVIGQQLMKKMERG